MILTFFEDGAFDHCMELMQQAHLPDLKHIPERKATFNQLSYSDSYKSFAEITIQCPILQVAEDQTMKSGATGICSKRFGRR